MAAEYKYGGFTIREVSRPTPIDRTSTAWDIFGETGLCKSGFASLAVAKHYIDACVCQPPRPSDAVDAIKYAAVTYKQLDLFGGGKTDG